MSFPQLKSNTLEPCIKALETLIEIYNDHYTRVFDSPTEKMKPTIPYQLNSAVVKEHERLMEVFTVMWRALNTIKIYIESQYPISIDGHNLGVAVLDELRTKVSTAIDHVCLFSSNMRNNRTAFENISYSAMDTLTKLNKYPSDLINVEEYCKQYWIRAQTMEIDIVDAFREYYLGIACQCMIIVHYMHTNAKNIKEPRKKIDSLCS